MKYFATLVACLLHAGAVSAGDIYVTTDAQGKKIYTDTPQSIPALKLEMHGTDAELPDAAAKSNSVASEAPKRSSSPAAAPQAAEQDRAAKCADARERYDVLMNSLRVYRLGPQGEAIFLTAEEMSEARVKVKLYIDKNCSAQ